MPKGYYLFLDDERMPNDVTWINLPKDDPWVIVRSYEEFTQYVSEHGLMIHVSFDNDLGDQQLEGRDCARWLVEQILDGKLTGSFAYTVHSKNVVAEKWISQYLECFFDFLKGQEQ